MNEEYGAWIHQLHHLVTRANTIENTMIHMMIQSLIVINESTKIGLAHGVEVEAEAEARSAGTQKCPMFIRTEEQLVNTKLGYKPSVHSSQ